MKLNFDEVKISKIQTYFVFNLPLDAARANMEFDIPGRFFYVLGFSPLWPAGTISVRFNEPTNDSIDLLGAYRKISTPFYRFFITNSAQASFVIQILIAPDELNFSIEDFTIPILARPAQTLIFQNVVCTVADTGYPISIATGTKKLYLHARTADMKIGYTGSSGTNFVTIPNGQGLYIDDVLLSPAFEVQSSTAGSVLEVMRWT